MARRLHLVPHGAHHHRAPDQRVRAHQAGAALLAHSVSAPGAAIARKLQGNQGVVLGPGGLSVKALLSSGSGEAQRSTAARLGHSSFWATGCARCFACLAVDRLIGYTVRQLTAAVMGAQFSGEEYLAARQDPAAAFAAPIAGHMNADHAEVMLSPAVDRPLPPRLTFVTFPQEMQARPISPTAYSVQL